jgi:hypothetical protein
LVVIPTLLKSALIDKYRWPPGFRPYSLAHIFAKS